MCVLRDGGIGQILVQPVYAKASRITVAWYSGRQREGLFAVSLGQVSGPQLSHSLCQLPVENGHLFLGGHAQYGWAVPIVPRTSWQRGAKE